MKNKLTYLLCLISSFVQLSFFLLLNFEIHAVTIDAGLTKLFNNGYTLIIKKSKEVFESKNNLKKFKKIETTLKKLKENEPVNVTGIDELNVRVQKMCNKMFADEVIKQGKVTIEKIKELKEFKFEP